MPDIEEQTKDWLSQFVVQHNVCPFAAPVIDRDQLALIVSKQSSYENIYLELLAYLQRFLTDVMSPETSLFICPQGFADFQLLLELQGELMDALASVGLDADVQLIAFHPDYCFEGEPQDDPANYTNRSPYPMLHILRQESINRLNIESQKLEQIPQNNIDLLRGLNKEQLQVVMNLSQSSKDS